MRTPRPRTSLAAAIVALLFAADALMLWVWTFRPLALYTYMLGLVGDADDSPAARLARWAGGTVAPRTPTGLMSLFDPEDLAVATLLPLGLLILGIVLVGTRRGSRLATTLAAPVTLVRSLSARMRVRAALAAIAILAVYLGWEIDAWRTWRLRAGHRKDAVIAESGEISARGLLADTKRRLNRLESAPWPQENSEGYYRSRASVAASRAVTGARLRREIAHLSALAEAYAARKRKYERAADNPWAAVEPHAPLPVPDDDSQWRFRGEYAKVLALDDQLARDSPDYVEAHRDAAWVRATCPDARFRDGERAIASATRACKLTEWKDLECLAVLAAAQAEAGNFPEAVKWQRKVAEGLADSPFAFLKDRLGLFEAGKPYRARRSSPLAGP
jgi:hypothetical protein